jgi:hypothetical protein
MNLSDRIHQDYISAMKSRDSVRSSTLNFLRSQIKNVMIDSGSESLSDEEIIPIIRKQVKQREDSIRQFEDGGRSDLADSERAQSDILKNYLPKPLSDKEISDLLNQAIEELKPDSKKAMGAIMKWMAQRTEGRVDNKQLSQMVKQRLESLS